MSKAAQRKDELQWTIEKPKPDNARKLRGICFIDPDDIGVEGHQEKVRVKSWSCLWNPPLRSN